ncbi:hypothetical protein Y032_0042g662 [Ancylostoma ceylanicum]|uniref:Uncharacterized protein n=1 Tax=Ancylostoma ceylanicum TaxID=53326 RepID=A0A016UGJ1_9BILA|nr:hypothetical protein Y032_0042g662 [Ancylostoma ceylanicum]
MGIEHTEGVDDSSTASKSTRRYRAAHDGIVAAVANLGFLGLILIICEALILYMTATLSTDSAALSFLVDVGYIAFLIVFMETTCYIMHRTIRTEEYDAMKKNV